MALTNGSSVMMVTLAALCAGMVTQTQRRGSTAASQPVPRAIRPREALLAGVGALVIYSALLVRMPYRPPLLNGLYTGLALSALYVYLRVRLSIRLPLWMLMGLV